GPAPKPKARLAFQLLAAGLSTCALRTPGRQPPLVTWREFRPKGVRGALRTVPGSPFQIHSAFLRTRVSIPRERSVHHRHGKSSWPARGKSIYPFPTTSSALDFSG